MERKPTRTRLTKTLRQAQIKAEALNVFIEHGYKATTTQDLAKAADISEVTLFRLFESKQDLFMACIKPILDQSLTLLARSPQSADPWSDFEDALMARVLFISENKGVFKLLLMETSMIPQGEGILNRMADSLSDILKSYGLLDPDLGVRLLVGYFLTQLFMPDSDEQRIRENTRSLIALFKLNPTLQGESNA